jgi:Uma2 family endonuclease
MSRVKSEPRLHDLVSGKPLPSLRMTEEEFVAWAEEDTRAEWVDGEVELMSPANVIHLRLTRWLIQVLGLFIEEHDLGELFATESMVRFASQRRRRLPDLHFVAKNRLHIVKQNHIEGAPDLIIEIVSPDSVSRDWQRKYIEYEKAGVREYWIIDPLSKKVEAYSLRGRKFVEIEQKDERVASVVVPKFFLRPQWFWQAQLPAVMKVLRELGIKS